jgi:hypothetical protein
VSRDLRKRIVLAGLLLLVVAGGVGCQGEGEFALGRSTREPVASSVSDVAEDVKETGPQPETEAFAEENPESDALSGNELAMVDSVLSLAREWHPDAQWYGIMPFTSMEWALALPGNQPAWIYRFGTPDGACEYSVQIMDGRVTGAMEMPMPDYIEPSLQRLVPIDPDLPGLLDSEAVRAAYVAQEGSWLAEYPDMLLDYRLVHLRECGRPTWMLIDAEHLAEPLFVMDAVTGESLDTDACLP